MFRKVIVSRARPIGSPRDGRSVRRLARRLARDTAGLGDYSKHLPAGFDPASRPLRPGRIVALIVGILALLFLFAGEIAAPGLIELAFAAMLLGCGLAAAHPRAWPGSTNGLAPSSLPRLDTEEQIRRHVRLLERRRHRCLDTLTEIQRCAAAERVAGRPTDGLDAASASLAAAVASFETGIAREQAAGFALRAARWLDRLPSLVEGLERLDLGACRHRLDRVESAGRDGEALAVEIRQHPCASEEAARRALALLEAGSKELARLRVDLLARSAAILARPDPPRSDEPRAAVDTAIERCWDWLCRNEARRELRLWADTSLAIAAVIPEPVTIVLPRGRDLGMLPFSLVLLGFTVAHASLAVGDVAMAVPAMLLPMAAFYALFLIPGVMLFQESVRARRREELTICGSSIMLRWRWALWSGVETVVVSPDEPVRREEVGRSGEHPIHRLCLHGIDGRKLSFGFGLSDHQHKAIIRQMGRKAAPMLPPRQGIGLAARGEPDLDGSLRPDRDRSDGADGGSYMPL